MQAHRLRITATDAIEPRRRRQVALYRLRHGLFIARVPAQAYGRDAVRDFC